MNKIVILAESLFKREKNCSTSKKHSAINLIAAFHFSYLIKTSVSDASILGVGQVYEVEMACEESQVKNGFLLIFVRFLS